MQRHSLNQRLFGFFGFMVAATSALPATAQTRSVQRTPTSTVCEKVGAATAAVGTAAASVGTVASTAGVAAVAHSSGAAILTTVGVGGTGYVAGTLGGAAATTLGFLSAPVVVVGSAALGVAGLSTYAYCRYKR
jgi:alpha-beta hydrolase superfamily lysophospholipase